MAVMKVTESLNGMSSVLNAEGNNFYKVQQKAPQPEFRMTDAASYYPVTISVEDEAGNKTVDNSTLLQVKNPFSFDFIVADDRGIELQYIDNVKIDVDIGDTNDFEMTMSETIYRTGNFEFGNRIYIPGTEYGGLIEDLEVDTGAYTIILRGHTWRGLLTQKVIELPEGQAFLYLNGELNTVIASLISGRFDGLFMVEEADTGISLKNWKVDPYDSLYNTIIKFLEANEYRLQIRYQQGPGLEPGYVCLRAVPRRDYSDVLEYSQDTGLYFNIRDYRQGINHLICAGDTETEPRPLLHLYVQKDGSIGKSPYYMGLAERTAFMEDDSAGDLPALEEKGKEELKKLQNYKTFQMSVNNIDLEVGDIIGGREYITGTELKKPVMQKIFRREAGRTSVEYKLKGED